MAILTPTPAPSVPPKFLFHLPRHSCPPLLRSTVLCSALLCSNLPFCNVFTCVVIVEESGLHRPCLGGQLAVDHCAFIRSQPLNLPEGSAVQDISGCGRAGHDRTAIGDAKRTSYAINRAMRVSNTAREQRRISFTTHKI
jgi:hypothetical protein